MSKTSAFNGPQFDYCNIPCKLSSEFCEEIGTEVERFSKKGLNPRAFHMMIIGSVFSHTFKPTISHLEHYHNLDLGNMEEELYDKVKNILYRAKASNPEIYESDIDIIFIESSYDVVLSKLIDLIP